MEMLARVESITIEGSGTRWRMTAKISVRLRLKRMEFPARGGISGGLDRHFHSLRFQCPDPEVRLFRGNQLGADRQLAFRHHFYHALCSPIGRATVAATGNNCAS